MTIKSALLFFSLSTLTVLGFGQDIDQTQMLLFPTSAKDTGLGSRTLTSSDDASVWFRNPSMVPDSALSRFTHITYGDYLSDIKYGTVAYGQKLKNGLRIWGGFQFLDYGKLERTSNTGITDGEFSSNGWRLASGVSHKIGLFSLGLNINYESVNFDGFSEGIVYFDLSGTYFHPTKDFTAALTIQQFGKFGSESFDNDVPLRLSAGMTFKPEFAPFRFTLQTFDLNIKRPEFIDEENETSGIDKVFYHVSAGVEILLHKNFNVMAGYNFNRRQQLKTEQGNGSSGMSLGFNLNLKGFMFSYSHGFYHQGGGVNYLTLQKDISSIFNK
ncbi:PorV/PorQ family protein [Marinigracilibium pacificum]|uniref:PorV/PorQ family protein n=1 Tax=Marinigracilibium pacificum TaxID=2729599 RepID=A0A848J9A7_9BACT|nr:PorV/PorQ family protein [Marinigracilibium pacificum]NMM49632.1 PorV/PorQ family protein [Marinigracilibium pacificum]